MRQPEQTANSRQPPHTLLMFILDKPIRHHVARLMRRRERPYGPNKRTSQLIIIFLRAAIKLLLLQNFIPNGRGLTVAAPSATPMHGHRCRRVLGDQHRPRGAWAALDGVWWRPRRMYPPL